MARVTLTPARRQALAVTSATSLYAISFGALSVAAGLSVLQTMALSLILFSGGSQFAFVGVIGSGGNPFAAVATSLFLSVRNAFYGLALVPVLRPLPPGKRELAAQLTIDESTAVSLAQPADDLPERRAGFWWTGVGIYLGWNAITVVGALLGSAIEDPGQWGLDAAAGAAFLGLLWPRLTTTRARITAVAGAAVALAATPVLPQGVPILLAALVAIVAGWAPARREGDEEPHASTEVPA